MKLSDTFVKGMYFENKDVKDAIKNKKLLNLDIDMSSLCNLSCIYCDKLSGNRENTITHNIPFKKLIDIVDQAKNMGCKTIQFIGAGEPTLDPNFWQIISYISNKGITSVIYTNGILINKLFAKRLYLLNTSIVLKFNSFNNNIQNKLVGRKYSKKLKSVLNILIQEKFTTEKPPRLAIDCVITKLNYKDVFEVFKFCRQNKISPQISGLIPHGNAVKNDLLVDKKIIMHIYKKAKIYDNKLGYKYKTNLPFLGGFLCKQVKYGCYIDVNGNVWECNAGDIKLGNIYDSSLKNIWNSDRAIDFRQKWKIGCCHIREKYQ
jgi:MoaA/NifB/PqqE/SkfB family radical SAM enzyme